MREKAENVQRKTLKELQKAGELSLRTTLKDYKKSGCLEGKYKEMRAGSGLLNKTVQMLQFSDHDKVKESLSDTLRIMYLKITVDKVR